MSSMLDRILASKQQESGMLDRIINNKPTPNISKIELPMKKAIKPTFKLKEPAIKKILPTIANTGAEIGKGIIDKSDDFIDATFQVFSSKLNPFMHIGGNAENKQRIAQEIIENTNSQKFIDETLGWGKKLSTGKTVQETIDEQSLVKSTNLGGEVSRGIGGMLPTLMAGNIGGSVAGTATMGVGAFGGGVEEAYKGGATRGQATAYGLGVAGIEMATEWITGGIPGVKTKWLSGIDRLAEKGIDKVGKKLAKELLKAGYKMIGEGGEEALADILNPYLKNITYTKGKKIDWEGVIDSAVTGAIIGGILNAPSTVSDVKGAYKPIIPIKQDQTSKIDTNLPIKQEQALNEAQTKFNEAKELNVPNYKRNLESLEQTMPVRKDLPLNPTKESSYFTKTKGQNLNFDITDRINRIKSLGVDTLMLGFDDKAISYNADLYRNMERAFKGNPQAFEVVKKELIIPFDQAKLNHTNTINNLASELRNNLDKWGIEKGSKDSALTQKYGEKLISLEQLKKETPNWENVVESDKWFRQKYDTLIDDINQKRAELYPNIEENILREETKLEKINSDIETKRAELKLTTNKKTAVAEKLKKQIERLETRKKASEDLLASEELWRGKIIPKRQDYYRHFQEMSTSFEGLYNILKTPAGISSTLAGVSDYTKPNAKFLSLAQKRKGVDTTYDAVGGFLNYITPASYAINIDPEIKVFREFTRDLATKTREAKQANKLLEYMTDFTNDLAGKTNPFDRPIQKLLDRKAVKTLDWVVGRIKSNAVLGNVGSSVAQILNLPQGIADVGNPKHLAVGLKNYIQGEFTSQNIYAESPFITARYANIKTQFETRLIDKPKHVAQWMLGALDETATKIIWNAEYNKAIANKIDNPIFYADNQTRKMVAGRGIGEVPLTQKSKLVSTLAPFTVEVNNSWHVMKDFVGEKEFGKLMIMFIISNLLNKAIKEIGGSGGVFDPIEAIKEASKEDLTMGQRLGRIGGEILSNMPFGQQAAAIYPEYEVDLGMGVKLPSRKDLFGQNDPTRFGTGNILTQAIKDPIRSLVTPYGGAQIRKTTEGLSMYSDDKEVKGSYTSSGKLRFPVKEDLGSKIQAGLFGQYSSKEARDYFDNNYMPLGENQIKEYKELNLPIKEYRDYRKKLPTKVEDKFKYINKLPYNNEQKNIMINNAVNRKNKIDISNFGDYGSYEEYDFATKNPNKYNLITKITTFGRYEGYKKQIEDIKFRNITKSTNDRKNAVIKYVNSLALSVPQKAMLIKTNYTGYNKYNEQIIKYINNQKLTKEEKTDILTQLGFKVVNGKARW